MKFEEALAMMRVGKRVRRSCWPRSSHIGVQQGLLLWHDIEAESIMARDWEIVEDAPLILPTDEGAVEVVAKRLLQYFGVIGWGDKWENVSEERRAYLRDKAELILYALREYVRTGRVE